MTEEGGVLMTESELLPSAGPTPEVAAPHYEDPYARAVTYMEKHHILHVFREITEHMIYSRPDDPLTFILGEVQNMIKQRDDKQTAAAPDDS